MQICILIITLSLKQDPRIHCAGSRVHTDAGLTLTWPTFAGPTLAWPTLAWPTFACPTLPRLSHARLTLAMRSVVVTHTITRVVVTHTTARTARTRPVPSRTHRRHPQHAQSLLSSPPTHRRGAAGVHVPHSAATCGRRVRTPDRAAPAAPARHVRSCRSGAPCRHATASPATAELRRYSWRRTGTFRRRGKGQCAGSARTGSWARRGG